MPGPLPFTPYTHPGPSLVLLLWVPKVSWVHPAQWTMSAQNLPALEIPAVTYRAAMVLHDSNPGHSWLVLEEAPDLDRSRHSPLSLAKANWIQEKRINPFLVDSLKLDSKEQ